MKLTVNAQGVEALLKLDPEHTIELAKDSAKTVADKIVSKITKESVEKSIKAHIENMLVVNPNWRSAALTEAANKLISAAIESKVDTLVSMKIMSPAYVEIQTNMKSIFQAEKEKVLQQLGKDIDSLIKDRIAAFFTKQLEN